MVTDWQPRVLEALHASAQKPLKLRDLVQRLHVTDDADRETLEAAVHRMAVDGAIERVSGQRFALPRIDGIKGVLSGHRDGYAFVTPEQADADTVDIYIPEDDRHGAMHKDHVEVRVSGPGRFGRVKGQVTRVLLRAHTQVVGTFRVREGATAVVPEEAKLYRRIRIPRDAIGGAVDGQKVVCEITQYPTAHTDPVGSVTAVLGFADEPGVDTRVLLLKHDLPEAFSPAAEAAAEAAPAEVTAAEAAGRLDLRALPMATIDGADAKDLDDAVSLERLDGGRVRLGVHIADVSHYVRPGSPLDADGYARATSVYLEGLVVPMLPHQLSNAICSLSAGVDRLALSCLMEVDREGVVQHYEIRPTVIHVDHRMTYDAVYEILTNVDSPLRAEYGEWTARFEDLDRLAQRLRRRRQARGSIMFEFPEASAAIDEHGAVEEIVLRETNRAHQLIEECMLLANETVARHLRDGDAPCVYRVHERPDEQAIERFFAFVASLGFRVSQQGTVAPRDLQVVSDTVKGAPEEHLVNTLMLRAMKQARYSSHNGGHFGLASGCYCHFTSPIRRYPDLMVHRVLYQLADEGVEAARTRWGDRLEVIAEHCSTRERVAVAAERESLRVKQLLFMEKHVGDEFEARITGVQRYGMFVETLRELADGRVHVSELDDDYYELLEDEHCLVGADTGRRYTLGDALTVQVLRVDVEQRELDFRVLSRAGADVAASGRRRGRGPARRRSGRPPRRRNR